MASKVEHLFVEKSKQVVVFAVLRSFIEEANAKGGKVKMPTLARALPHVDASA